MTTIVARNYHQFIEALVKNPHARCELGADQESINIITQGDKKAALGTFLRNPVKAVLKNGQLHDEQAYNCARLLKEWSYQGVGTDFGDFGVHNLTATGSRSKLAAMVRGLAIDNAQDAARALAKVRKWELRVWAYAKNLPATATIRDVTRANTTGSVSTLNIDLDLLDDPQLRAISNKRIFRDFNEHDYELLQQAAHINRDEDGKPMTLMGEVGDEASGYDVAADFQFRKAAAQVNEQMERAAKFDRDIASANDILKRIVATAENAGKSTLAPTVAPVSTNPFDEQPTLVTIGGPSKFERSFTAEQMKKIGEAAAKEGTLSQLRAQANLERYETELTLGTRGGAIARTKRFEFAKQEEDDAQEGAAVFSRRLIEGNGLLAEQAKALEARAASEFAEVDRLLESLGNEAAMPKPVNGIAFARQARIIREVLASYATGDSPWYGVRDPRPGKEYSDIPVDTLADVVNTAKEYLNAHFFNAGVNLAHDLEINLDSGTQSDPLGDPNLRLDTLHKWNTDTAILSLYGQILARGYIKVPANAHASYSRYVDKETQVAYLREVGNACKAKAELTKISLNQKIARINQEASEKDQLIGLRAGHEDPRIAAAMDAVDTAVRGGKKIARSDRELAKEVAATNIVMVEYQAYADATDALIEAILSNSLAATIHGALNNLPPKPLNQ